MFGIGAVVALATCTAVREFVPIHEIMNERFHETLGVLHIVELAPWL